MVILGYVLAAIMGLTLGLIGAGGSILTVPILVYVLDVKPVVATGYSLLVVGSSALAGALRYWRQGLVNMRAAITFVIPAMVTVLGTRAYIVPSIPDPVLGITKDSCIMMLFAVLMIVVALFMLKSSVVPTSRHSGQPLYRTGTLVLGSAGIGLLTGMVGAGGGFLIIPTLIALFGLHMKEAIGTSLTVIAINSLVGFNGDIAAGIPLDYRLLGVFLGVTLSGMLIGTQFGRTMDGQKLKKIFAVFTLVTGVTLLVKEIF